MVFLKSAAIGLLSVMLVSPAGASLENSRLVNPELQREDVTRLREVKEWILAFMVKTAPPGRKLYYPESQETPEAALVRYESIAQDIIEVVYNPNVTPLFKGPNGRSQTISMILSVMLHESGFMRHVDYGLGKYSRGDNGASWCMMQLKVGEGRTMKWNRVKNRPVAWNDPKDEIQEGYTGEELVQNRHHCIAEGLKILRVSFGACGKLPMQDRLRSYASGSCEKGAEASHSRVNRAIRWYQKSFTGQWSDEQVMGSLERLGSKPFSVEPVTSVTYIL